MTSLISFLSLLMMVVLSVPSTEQAVLNQHLCGSHLVEALYLVCADNGFFYKPSGKREVDQFPDRGTQADELEAFSFGTPENMKVKRGIVEQCCHKPCSLYELENYCNVP
ncbi:insulin [Protopterus annectens]|uniref:insulin n=1 Tax=Protopterus annectens TaxID=7888 RepID=UPI001CF9430D|nr:insulin [Protopterus annectens]